METEQANLRVRPLRLAFLVDPRNRNLLHQVLCLNSCLWGGAYNYLIPHFRATPLRYREKHLRTPPAAKMIDGLIEAFQPDFVVESTPDTAKRISFPAERVIRLEALLEPDDVGRRSIGIDLRSVAEALYEETFRFVERHPQRVILPRPSNNQYDLLFAAAFGEVPTSGNLAICRDVLASRLNAQDIVVPPSEFNGQFSPGVLYPLRLGRYRLSTRPLGWRRDPTLFYMDERSTYDIIEYWNLRAIGWKIRPLPVSWASILQADSEHFIEQAHRPYPPPSNAMHDANFLCSRSCSFEAMQQYVSSLRRPSDALITVDPRFPRLWEEWGRHADHAEPQQVTHVFRSADTSSLGSVVSLPTAIPEFLEYSSYASSRKACVNVIAALPGSAAVIPWQLPGMNQVAGRLSTDAIWIGREGVTLLVGKYQTRRTLQRPSPMNVFRSWAAALGFQLELSASGRTAEQMARSLGGRIRLFGHEEILRLFDHLAHGDLELELPDSDPGKKRRVRTAAAPEAQIREVLGRVSGGDAAVARNYLKALVDCHALRLGMRLQCPECQEHTWYGMGELDVTLTCARCLQLFQFPQSKPPRDAWAYRVAGPFAVENLSHRAYSVLMAVQFLVDHLAEASTWVPSFTLTRNGGTRPETEADFAMFVRPGQFTKFTDPVLVISECKSFGSFEHRDFARMRKIAKLFPGAVLCFCTFVEELSPFEKRRIAQITRAGRRPLKTGRQANPVLVLTRAELFGQFDAEGFGHRYPSAFVERAQRVFAVGEIQEICDLTQQLHLGIESYHQWRDNRRVRKSPTPIKPLR